MTGLHRIIRGLFTLMALFTAAALHAQSTIDTGSLRGKVLDGTGKTLPGAIVRAKGPQGTKASETDSQGNFNLPFLTPGLYEVTVTMDGYSTQVQSGVTVIAQQITGQTFKLSEGTETIVVRAGANVDTHSSTATTSVNLTTAMQAFAQEHSFTAAFDFAPGAIANSGVGGGNYSIAGASGLENQYFIGGVNITNSGYGAIGAYDVTGAGHGTGITTSFLDNLDIREGGFEAEYGGALGGVISATIKTGSNDFHGGITTYYTPRSLNGARRTFNRPGGFINEEGSNNLDAALEFGGPIVKDKLFFFVGYNPVWNQDYFRFDINPADLAMDAIVAPFANTEYDLGGRTRVDNYAAHLTWNLTQKHKLDLAIFGSPDSRSGIIRGIGRRVNPATDLGIPANPPSATGVPITEPGNGVLGSQNVRDISASLKYFGVITRWMNVEAVVSFHRNQVSETPDPLADKIRYTDRRRGDIYNARARAGQPQIASPARYDFGGLGFYQGGSNDENIGYLLKVTHNFEFGGEHELKWGVDYADLKYRENVLYTGPKPTVYLGALGSPSSGIPYADSYATIRTGVQATIRCFSINTAPNANTIPKACTTGGAVQRYRVYRGNFNPPTPDTLNKELNLFIQDKWTIRNVTLNLGVRWTREKVSNPSSYKMVSARTGNPLVAGTSDNPAVNPPAVGSRTPDCVSNADYSPSCYIAGPGIFVGSAWNPQAEFAPRIGISWDVLGNGKTKLYANFARLFERIPNDLAVRSFGNELGVTNIAFTNPDLTGQSRIAFVTGTDPTRVQPNTRLPYKDDFSLGYQFEVRPRFLIDVKANYRRQGRILEDTQTSTVEAIQNYYYGYAGYEIFPGFGYAKFGEYVLANVGSNSPTTFNQVYPVGTGPCPRYPTLTSCDGQFTGEKTPVTFGKPKSEYQAISLTFTKTPGEGEHLTLQATYRLSRLTGNYEGLFRNDNGQSDPNITSLFDFPDSPLLHSQYTMGRLNTDTPHSLKINVGYNDLFIKNLYSSVTFKWQSGQMRTPLLAHPIYQNAGEIPGIDPQYLRVGGTFILTSYTPVQRGYLGRQADDATWNFKLGYKWNLGKSNLDFSVLVNNAFNDNHVSKYEDDVETTTAVLNPFYGSPSEAKAPRSFRLGARWSF